MPTISPFQFPDAIFGDCCNLVKAAGHEPLYRKDADGEKLAIYIAVTILASSPPSPQFALPSPHL